MSALPGSEASASHSSTGAGSGLKGHLYLQSQTKVVILAVCIVLMLTASFLAVLQPLNPEPTRITFSTGFWYPRETNPYGRLQSIDCPQDNAKDYACRLNSIAVNIPDGLRANDPA